MRVMSALCAVLFFGACGDDIRPEQKFWDDRPVDGYYRVQVSHLKNTCGDGMPSTTARPFVDMYLRDDGLYDIKQSSLDIPLPFTLEGVARPGGNVDHEYSYVGSGETEYSFTLSGIVTPDSLDLVAWMHGYPDCEIERHLVGTPWPLADPEALEGFYDITSTSLDNTCAGSERVVGAPHNGIITISESLESGIWFSASDGWKMNPDAPDADGNVSWQGQVLINAGFFDLPFETTLNGFYGPSGVQLLMNMWELGETPDTTTCSFETSLIGQKWLPTLTEIENDYRGTYVIHDGCAPATEQDSEYAGGLRLVPQPDGTVELWDVFGKWSLSNTDGDLYGQFGSPQEGWLAIFAGTVAPPYFSYSIRNIVYDANRVAKCTFEMSLTNAHVRYVFE